MEKESLEEVIGNTEQAAPQFKIGKTLSQEVYHDLTKRMLDLQMMFNNRTNGECWLEGVTEEGKTIDWMLCIKKEIGEAIDSYSWKHWKAIAQETDIQNVEIELTDAYHFIISEIIRLFFLRRGSLSVEEIAAEEEQLGTIMNQIALAIMPVNDATNVNSVLDQMTAVSEQAETVISAEQKVYFLLRSMFMDNLDIRESYVMFLVIMQHMDEYFGFGFEELYVRYIAKNCLNVFRQEHGYKEGTYYKIWNGISGGLEDNEIMMLKLKDLQAHDALTFENLYEALDTEYLHVVAFNEANNA